MSTRYLPIVAYLIFGAIFGLLTYRHRHLFSEGPTQRDEGAGAGAIKGRIFWAMLCTCLWPVMALTGLHSWWLLWRRRVAGAAAKRAEALAQASSRKPPLG